jgi:hypothetical protein
MITRFLRDFLSPTLEILRAIKDRPGTITGIVVTIIFSAWSLLDGRQNSKINIRGGLEVDKPVYVEMTDQGEVVVDVKLLLAELDEYASILEISRRNKNLSYISNESIEEIKAKIGKITERCGRMTAQVPLRVTYDNNGTTATSVRRIFIAPVLKIDNALQSSIPPRSNTGDPAKDYDFAIPAGKRVTDTRTIVFSPCGVLLRDEYRSLIQELDGHGKDFARNLSALSYIPVSMKDELFFKMDEWREHGFLMRFQAEGIFGENFEAECSFPLASTVSNPQIAKVSCIGNASLKSLAHFSSSIATFIYLTSILISTLLLGFSRVYVDGGSKTLRFLRWLMIIVALPSLLVVGLIFDAALFIDMDTTDPTSSWIQIVAQIAKSNVWPFSQDFAGWDMMLSLLIAGLIGVMVKDRRIRILWCTVMILGGFFFHDFSTCYAEGSNSLHFLLREIINLMGALILICIIELILRWPHPEHKKTTKTRKPAKSIKSATQTR